ncbi:hypothetical protein [Listeria booriae]|uniref:DUF4375 domain-containing protein n=1 Tax=Listeria booriae TaxID=1552123 RepID=A0A841ZZR4_9LIST|nr:hypothetical protein [Listeria booriae]MBC1567201.1 hypothetical protein [Listeria booriae]
MSEINWWIQVVIPMATIVFVAFNYFLSKAKFKEASTVSDENLKLSKKNYELAKRNKELTEINNNVSSREFYKELYDGIYSVYYLYEKAAYEITYGGDFDELDFGPWTDIKSDAMRSVNGYENIGVDSETFEKIESGLNAFRYCLPKDILKQLEKTRAVAKAAAYPKMLERFYNPSINPELEGNEQNIFDRDKELFKMIEEFLEMMSAKRYY